jgi:hypothetical protein
MGDNVQRDCARAILATCKAGADYGRDFHALPYGTQSDLAEAAKFCGYRKPRGANGSTARYFHARLVRLAKES